MSDSVANRYRTSVGLRNVGSYQISGHPYITGSALIANEEKKIQFPYITKKITVIASGSQGGGNDAHRRRELLLETPCLRHSLLAVVLVGAGDAEITLSRDRPHPLSTPPLLLFLLL